jgi:Family of unknown function (DUF6868)
MMTLETLTEFLGWVSIINIAVLLISGILVIVMRGFISKIHSKFFGLEQKDSGLAYFQYLGQYKIATIVLNIAPYIALKIMA